MQVFRNWLAVSEDTANRRPMQGQALPVAKRVIENARGPGGRIFVVTAGFLAENRRLGLVWTCVTGFALTMSGESLMIWNPAVPRSVWKASRKAMRYAG